MGLDEEFLGVIDGAVDAGWVGHLWQSDADTRDWLGGLGVLG